MSGELTDPDASRDSSASRGWLGRLISNPRPLIATFVALVAFGLVFSSPLVGIAVVAALLLASLYLGGRSQIAAVVTYVGLLYVVSPRLALGVYEVTPALLVGLGCVLLWLSGRSNIGEVSRLSSPMTKVVIGYMCVVMFTYGLGLTQPLLAEQFASADRDLAKLLGLIGVMLLVLDVVRSHRQLIQVFGVIVAGATFVGFAAILQIFFEFDIVSEMKLPGFTDRGQSATGQQLRLGQRRATGTARHPIELATMASIVLPMALHFVNYAKLPRVRAAAMLSSTILIVALLLTLSRSAYLGLAVALVMLLPRWTSQRRFRFGIAVVPALFGLALVAPEAFDAARDLVSNWSGEGVDASRVSARTEDYEIVRELVLQHPWFGQGYGTFFGSQAFAVDNQYLSTMIETGIVGTIALLTMLTTGYVLARRSYRIARSESRRDLSASVAASVMVGAVSFGVFDAMAFDLAVGSVFVMVAMAGALHVVTVLQPDDPDEELTIGVAGEPSTHRPLGTGRRG